jgi:AcrR family transcriptional regulator
MHEVPPKDRRAKNSATTRQVIRDVARTHFAQFGYAKSRVDDIARDSGVSPATVYSTVNGKAGLLEFWMNEWSSDPSYQAVFREIEAATQSSEIVRIAVESVRSAQSQWGDVIRVVREASAEDPFAAQALTIATQRYRDAVRLVAQRLFELDSLRAKVATPDAAADALWFYLGYRSFDVLIDENGWDESRAEQWLTEQILDTIVVRPIPMGQ